MKSQNSLYKTIFNFHLSENPLPTKQRKFLVNDNLKGINKSQYQSDIRHRLGESFRYLHHILPNTQNLRKSDIYEIFNASTLEQFFQNLLRDVEYNHSYNKNYKYDFRTSEIARTMFEIAVDYLASSPHFKDRYSTIASIKSVAEDFKVLSRAELDQEREDIIENKKEEYEKIQKEIGQYEYSRDTEEIEEFEYQRLQKHIDDRYRAILLLDLHYRQLSSNNDPKNIERKEISEMILEIVKELKDSVNRFDEYRKRREKLSDLKFKLSHMYSQIIPYACAHNPLPELLGTMVVSSLKSLGSKIEKEVDREESLNSYLMSSEGSKLIKLGIDYLLKDESIYK